MKEQDINKTIKQVMAEPKAPKELVLRTIERGKAIQYGAAAEKKLHEMNNEGPNFETERLAACSIVGRLMQVSNMPNGATAEMMIKNLEQNATFKKAVQKSSEELLIGIQNGDLVKQILNHKTEKKKSDLTINMSNNDLIR